MQRTLVRVPSRTASHVHFYNSNGPWKGEARVALVYRGVTGRHC